MFASTMWCSCVCFSATLFTLICLISANSELTAKDYKVINRIIKECSSKTSKYSCLADKAAVVVEMASDWDVPLFEGLVLAKNDEKINYSRPRGFADGIDRLSNALVRFFDTHTVSLDFTQDREQGRGDEGGLGGGGGISDKKADKKEKKYVQYALMALLGVFGISGPMILKTLALIAGKALIASKIALIIVGSVALKKIFEKDDDHSSVKVHTHTIPVHDHNEHEEYDRYMTSGAYKFLKTV